MSVKEIQDGRYARIPAAVKHAMRASAEAVDVGAGVKALVPTPAWGAVGDVWSFAGGVSVWQFTVPELAMDAWQCIRVASNDGHEIGALGLFTKQQAQPGANYTFLGNFPLGGFNPVPAPVPASASAHVPVPRRETAESLMQKIYADEGVELCVTCKVKPAVTKVSKKCQTCYEMHRGAVIYDHYDDGKLNRVVPAPVWQPSVSDWDLLPDV